MRRWLLALALLAAQISAAQAQETGSRTTVSLSMALDSTLQSNGARMPIVYLRNLLVDERWKEALEKSLPLIVSYTMQTWRSREGWIDELASETSWQTIVTKEPLQEEYTVTFVVANRRLRPSRFALRDAADRYLNLPQRIAIYPRRDGRFYYTVSARITALSDRDIDQLERFLAGDPTLDVPEQGTTVGRGIRRFLLRLAGLPSQVLQARSEQFQVQHDDDDDEDDDAL